MGSMTELVSVSWAGSQVLRTEVQDLEDGKCNIPCKWEWTQCWPALPLILGGFTLTLNCKLLLMQVVLFFPCCHVYNPSLSYTRTGVYLISCEQFREIIFFFLFLPFAPHRISFLLIQIPKWPHSGVKQVPELEQGK